MIAPNARSIRNNNPGNMELSKDHWEGMAPEQPDAPYITFLTPEYGFRAMAIELRNYQRLHGTRTLWDLITRWAPPTDASGKPINPTIAYIKFVSGRTGTDSTTPVNLEDRTFLAHLVAAMAEFETGTAWQYAVVQRGVSMAFA